MSRPPRILAVGDSDSYVKWGAFLVDRMPDRWDRELAVLASPWHPSAEQFAAGVAGTRWEGSAAPTVTLDELARTVQRTRPDVVLAAVRGPSVKVVHRAVTAGPHRPVIAAGLPGISFPPTRKAVAYRAETDLVIVHSRRERAAYTSLAARMGIAQSFALASLPFVTRHDAAPATPAPDGPIVFAVQAKFPESLGDRTRVAEALVAAARRHPSRRVVVKVRARPGEPQTHAELHDLGDLVRRLDPPHNLVVEGGPMADHLRGAGGFATVSSTALLEAIGAGVPVLALGDFGIRRSLVNTGFVDAGFLGTLDDLVEARFRHPDPEWLVDNWFHDPAEDDWAARAEELIAARDAGALPARRQRTGTAGGALRLAWDRKRALGDLDRSLGGRVALAVGTPALHALKLARRIRRLARGTHRARFSGAAARSDADAAETVAPA